MTHTLLQQFNQNVGKTILALPSTYHAFKAKVESAIRQDNGLAGNSIVLTSDKPYQVYSGVAVVDFYGFTVNTCDAIEEKYFGCVSLQRFCDTLQQAAVDESVTSIVINFDSGGGYTMYGEETCQLIKDIDTVKPVFAYTSGYMCSMAYKVACNARYIFASPTSMVGSIGSYCEYYTYAGASELGKDGITESKLDMGLTVTTFQVGNQKTVGSETIKLSDEQKQQILAELQTHTQTFKDLVKANRSGVTDETMQGQCYLGKEAMAQNTGLIDGNINSLSQLLQLIVTSAD